MPDADQEEVDVRPAKPSKHLSHLGRHRTPRDRRADWAHEDREISEKMSRGEKRARRIFWGKINGPRRVDYVHAIRAALQLDEGPIPGFQTQEEFDAYWTRLRLREIANRWASSRRTLKAACQNHEETLADIQADAPLHVKTLREVSLDKKAPAAARVTAAKIGLAIAGIKPPEDEEPSKSLVALITGRETVQQLEELLPQIVHLEPDVNRARLATELIYKRLAVLDPETYGPKLKVEHSGVGLGDVLNEMDARRALAQVEMQKAAAIDVTDVSLLSEDSEEGHE